MAYTGCAVRTCNAFPRVPVGAQDMLNFNPAVARLAKFFFIAAFMGHLLGCFWFWVGTVQEGEDWATTALSHARICQHGA